MFFPIRYDDLENEYWHLLNHVTVWDVSVERQVEITGPDAAAFANLLTPRDLTKCAVGQGKYVVITADDGGIINDPVLMRLGDESLLAGPGRQRRAAVGPRPGLQRRHEGPHHRARRVSPMQIQGPKSKDGRARRSSATGRCS